MSETDQAIVESYVFEQKDAWWVVLRCPDVDDKQVQMGPFRTESDAVWALEYTMASANGELIGSGGATH